MAAQHPRATGATAARGVAAGARSSCTVQLAMVVSRICSCTVQLAGPPRFLRPPVSAGNTPPTAPPCGSRMSKDPPSCTVQPDRSVARETVALLAPPSTAPTALPPVLTPLCCAPQLVAIPRRPELHHATRSELKRRKRKARLRGLISLPCRPTYKLAANSANFLNLSWSSSI